MIPCDFYLESYNIFNFSVAAILSKMTAILDLLKPRGSGLKLLRLKPEMLLVCSNLALCQIWQLYPPGEHIPPFERLTHSTNHRTCVLTEIHTQLKKCVLCISGIDEDSSVFIDLYAFYVFHLL